MNFSSSSDSSSKSDINLEERDAAIMMQKPTMSSEWSDAIHSDQWKQMPSDSAILQSYDTEDHVVRCVPD